MLFAGGVDANGAVATAQVFDPATGTFQLTGSMAHPRSGHTAILLSDGRVLVLGGVEDGPATSAELYDPAAGRFVPTGPMLDAPLSPTAALLSDGRVLVTSGNVEPRAELYDPATGMFSWTGAMLNVAQDRTATRLVDGRVLFAGGAVDPKNGTTVVLNSAEIYDPATGKFSPTGRMTEGRRWHTATLLVDGRVLIAGGWSLDAAGKVVALKSAEIYDPATGKFARCGSMTATREKASASLLADGRVLIAGGRDETANEWLKSVELFDAATSTFGPTASMADGHSGSAATLLLDGSVLFGGSVSELYLP